MDNNNISRRYDSAYHSGPVAPLTQSDQSQEVRRGTHDSDDDTSMEIIVTPLPTVPSGMAAATPNVGAGNSRSKKRQASVSNTTNYAVGARFSSTFGDGVSNTGRQRLHPPLNIDAAEYVDTWRVLKDFKPETKAPPVSKVIDQDMRFVASVAKCVCDFMRREHVPLVPENIDAYFMDALRGAAEALTAAAEELPPLVRDASRLREFRFSVRETWEALEKPARFLQLQTNRMWRMCVPRWVVAWFEKSGIAPNACLAALYDVGRPRGLRDMAGAWSLMLDGTRAFVDGLDAAMLRQWQADAFGDRKFIDDPSGEDTSFPLPATSGKKRGDDTELDRRIAKLNGLLQTHAPGKTIRLEDGTIDGEPGGSPCRLLKRSALQGDEMDSVIDHLIKDYRNGLDQVNAQAAAKKETIAATAEAALEEIDADDKLTPERAAAKATDVERKMRDAAVRATRDAADARSKAALKLCQLLMTLQPYGPDTEVIVGDLLLNYLLIRQRQWPARLHDPGMLAATSCNKMLNALKDGQRMVREELSLGSVFPLQVPGRPQQVISRFADPFDPYLVSDKVRLLFVEISPSQIDYISRTLCEKPYRLLTNSWRKQIDDHAKTILKAVEAELQALIKNKAPPSAEMTLVGLRWPSDLISMEEHKACKTDEQKSAVYKRGLLPPNEAGLIGHRELFVCMNGKGETPDLRYGHIFGFLKGEMEEDDEHEALLNAAYGQTMVDAYSFDVDPLPPPDLKDPAKRAEWAGQKVTRVTADGESTEITEADSQNRDRMDKYGLCPIGGDGAVQYANTTIMASKAKYRMALCNGDFLAVTACFKDAAGQTVEVVMTIGISFALDDGEPIRIYYGKRYDLEALRAGALAGIAAYKHWEANGGPEPWRIVAPESKGSSGRNSTQTILENRPRQNVVTDTDMNMDIVPKHDVQVVISQPSSSLSQEVDNVPKPGGEIVVFPSASDIARRLESYFNKPELSAPRSHSRNVGPLRNCFMMTFRGPSDQHVQNYFMSWNNIFNLWYKDKCIYRSRDGANAADSENHEIRIDPAFQKFRDEYINGRGQRQGRGEEEGYLFLQISTGRFAYDMVDKKLEQTTAGTLYHVIAKAVRTVLPELRFMVSGNIEPSRSLAIACYDALFRDFSKLNLRNMTVEHLTADLRRNEINPNDGSIMDLTADAHDGLYPEHPTRKLSAATKKLVLLVYHLRLGAGTENAGDDAPLLPWKSSSIGNITQMRRVQKQHRKRMAEQQTALNAFASPPDGAMALSDDESGANRRPSALNEQDYIKEAIKLSGSSAATNDELETLAMKLFPELPNAQQFREAIRKAFPGEDYADKLRRCAMAFWAISESPDHGKYHAQALAALPRMEMKDVKGIECDPEYRGFFNEYMDARGQKPGPLFALKDRNGELNAKSVCVSYLFDAAGAVRQHLLAFDTFLANRKKGSVVEFLRAALAYALLAETRQNAPETYADVSKWYLSVERLKFGDLDRDRTYLKKADGWLLSDKTKRLIILNASLRGNVNDDDRVVPVSVLTWQNPTTSKRQPKACHFRRMIHTYQSHSGLRPWATIESSKGKFDFKPDVAPVGQ